MKGIKKRSFSGNLQLPVLFCNIVLLIHKITIMQKSTNDNGQINFTDHTVNIKKEENPFRIQVKCFIPSLNEVIEKFQNKVGVTHRISDAKTQIEKSTGICDAEEFHDHMKVVGKYEDLFAALYYNKLPIHQGYVLQCEDLPEYRIDRIKYQAIPNTNKVILFVYLNRMY